MLINGHAVTTIEATDRGLHYGDGLFETMRCENGRVRWLAYHLQRLASGCQRLRIQMPDPNLLQSELNALAADHKRALVKLVITRGPMVRRGYRPAGTEQPTRIVSIHAWPGDDDAPLRLGISAISLADNPLLAGIKHLSRLENVLAQQEAAERGLDEVVMCCSSGEVVCGSMSNLIVVSEKGMLTPALNNAGVHGVMRTLSLSAAAATGISLAVAPVSPVQLRTATAVYCSNIRWGLRRVEQFEGRQLGSEVRIAQLEEWIHAQP
jgi:4-amino-4-deoxychorismate lyase